ncbi:MAG: HDOD domain-containing protein [Burkholderiaceae bacterium]
MVDPVDPFAGTPVAVPPAVRPGSFAHYQLRRMLAESAMARVWQAHDPRADREVRIKVFRPGHDVDAATLARWVHEANGSSHLVHPMIVPLHDVGVHEGQPFQVATWVPGQSLAELMKAPAPVPARRAVSWMLDLLDALVLAHGAGIVHGRLHPGNILIGVDGRARLLDFAQVTRVADTKAHAAQSRAMAAWLPTDLTGDSWSRAGKDIHALGLVLACLLSNRANAVNGAAETVTPALVRQLALERGTDEALRDIVFAAVHADPAQRHAGAQEFHAQLAQWSGHSVGLAPARVAQAVAGAEGALQRLIKQMQENQDFPAMSHAVSRIQAMVASDTESVGAVADEILKDVALSNKLLRIVNSAYYARGGSIATVSRAVTLIGFNGVRNLALGLVLLEGMRDKAHAQELTDEFLRALMAASIAREIASGSHTGEEAFIGAMFQDLGRLLTMYYFPKEAQQVRQLLLTGAGKLTEQSASVRVLGLGYEALGQGIAKLWDLPPDIRRYLHKPTGDPPARGVTDLQERLRWTTLAANHLADVLLDAEPAEQLTRLDSVLKRYARAIDSTPTEMQEAMERARRKLIELAALMELQTTPGSAAERLVHPALAASSQHGDAAATSGLAMPALDVAIARGVPLEDKLAAGLSDVAKAPTGGAALTGMLHMVIDTIFRSTGAAHVLFCLRDAKSDSLTGRFGRGEGVETLVQGFQVPLAPSSTDLFHAICSRGADTLIADTRIARIAERLPPWYRKLAQPQSLLLLPIRLGDKPVALIYADTVGTRPLAFTEKEMALLHRLRDKAQLALRQSPS